MDLLNYLKDSSPIEMEKWAAAAKFMMSLKKKPAKKSAQTAKKGAKC